MAEKDPIYSERHQKEVMRFDCGDADPGMDSVLPDRSKRKAIRGNYIQEAGRPLEKWHRI